MLSLGTEKKIEKILLILDEGERSIDINRKILSENNDFDTFQVFRYFDTYCKNKIDIYDIMNFLNSKKIFVKELEIKFLMLFYDINGDGYLSYNEFLNIILNTNSIKTKTILSKNNYKLSFKIEYLLLKIFEKEIQLSRNLLNQINELNKENDFNIHKIFHNLKGKNNCITKESLKNFFDRINENTQNSRINNILKRLDINKDGKIDLFEFHIFLGFPNCSRCCPLIPCSICGCSFCDDCICEVNCYVHSCIHKYSSQIPSLNKIKNEHKREYYFNLTNLNLNDNNYDIGEKFEHILDNQNLNNNKESKFFNTLNEINIDNNIISNSLNEEELSENKNMINISLKESLNSSNNCILGKEYVISKNDSFEFLPKKKKLYFYCNFCKCNPCTCIPMYPLSSKMNKEDLISYEQYQFNDYLKELMNAENQIENIKIDLTLKNDFNVEDIFRIFEYNEKGFLDINDLKNGFNLLNVNINDLDIRLLINRFDLNKKGYINFADFFDMIVPYETEYRNIVENKIPNSCCPCIVPDILSFSTKNLLKNLFEMLIDYENKFNCMKRGYNMLIKKLKNIFNEIDSNCLGFFNNDDFNYYLIKNNLFRSIKQSNLLYIRLDKNRDGKIDYNEMENEFKC